jgi:probable HAF family extracellular repeat protein
MSRIRIGVWTAMVLILVPLAGAQSYTVTDLGVLPGATSSNAAAINDRGDVVGNSNDHAFLWTPNGGMQDLGTLPGDIASYGYAINDSGTVVGVSQGEAGNHAFLWTQAGGMKNLGNLGGHNWAGATGINSSGAVVGYSHLADNITTRAFLWTQAAGMQDLGTLAGFAQSAANAINNAGQVAGTSISAQPPYVYRAFFWTANAGMQAIGTLGKDQDSYALAISGSGRVVGDSGTLDDGTSSAFGWTQSHGIQSLDAGNQSVAVGINALSEIVGGCNFGNVSSAFVWTPTKHLQNLNDLIPANSGWVLREAIAINQSGQIAAYGSIGDEYHAALLTPTN